MMYTKKQDKFAATFGEKAKEEKQKCVFDLKQEGNKHDKKI